MAVRVARCAVVLAAACLLMFAQRPAGAAEDSLRLRIAWQVALDGVGFSPGVIDGKLGPKTERATREFQNARGLPVSGKLDEATTAALGIDAASALTTLTIQTSDLQLVGPAPKDWLERSQLSTLAYPSLQEMVAERHHCTQALLARLNPEKSLAQLQVGDSLVVPNVCARTAFDLAEKIEIDLAQKQLRVFNGAGKVVALFHCSIAADKAKLPTRPEARVMVVSENPNYTFDPEKWPEVRGITQKLIIPPGPRNPVGLCWIGLDLPGYGIHGTPAPEMIGKTGSHGCFRLANWDAVRLGRMTRVGTRIYFVNGEIVPGRKTADTADDDLCPASISD